MKRRRPPELGETVRALVLLAKLDGELRERETSEAAVARRMDDNRLRQAALEELVARDRLLLAAAEEAGEDPNRLRAVISEAEGQLLAVTRELAEQGQRMKALAPQPEEAARLAERRRAWLAQIPGDLVELYQVLARARRHPAIVPLANGYCSGCHLRVPPQLANSIAQALEISRCPHCKRMLYDPLMVEAQHA